MTGLQSTLPVTSITERMADKVKQHKTPETGQRVRDNQRRSRARRKELLDDLQTRLDECHRRGVQATVEMQQAARHVARENQRLRALLTRKGVPDAEVDAFLRVGDPSFIDEQMLRAQGGRTTTHCDEGQSPTTAYGGRTSEPPFGFISRDKGSAEGSSLQRDYPLAPSTDFPGPSEDTPSYLAEPDFGSKPSMETSCDVAASILANMQGHGDTNRARVSLGCGPGSGTCVVNNMRVLDLLDETV